MLSRTSRALRVLVLSAVGSVTGCDRNPIDVGLEAALQGTWESLDGLTISFDGDQATILEFGASPLGTNSGVLAVGDAFISSIVCDESSCTGEIIDPVIVGGVLSSFTRVSANISAAGDALQLTSASSGGNSLTFERPSGSGGIGGATLTSSATCDQWWSALVGVGTWRFVEIQNSNGYQGAVGPGATITFTSDFRYELSPDAQQYLPDSELTGTVGLDENIFDSGYCRLKRFSDSQYQMTSTFPHSLANGELLLHLSYDGGQNYWRLQAQ